MKEEVNQNPCGQSCQPIPRRNHVSRSADHRDSQKELWKKPKTKTTELYVKIHDLIQDVALLEQVLTTKVNLEGFQLSLLKKDVMRSDTCTYCSVICPSKDLAKRLKHLLLKDRHMFTPLIDCNFTGFDQSEVLQSRAEQRKEELRQQAQFELEKKSTRALKVHEEKLQAIMLQIDQAKGKLNNLYTATQTKAEISALEAKVDENIRQKEEFCGAVDEFRKRVATALNGTNFEKTVNEARKQFGIECCRFEKSLPMYARRRDIVDLVRSNQVSVILGETGSGKSTQMVQYLLEADFCNKGAIVCTQPRKVAAISLATHVSSELATNVGKEVGYKVGSKCRTGDLTKVIFMTDHCLLNECLADPTLKAFSCIVVDEAHERSLYTDLLLGMIKRCLQKRPELRVIITSATIDPEVFVKFFGNCPVLKVSGRTFPVDVVWLDDNNEEDEFENYMQKAVKKAEEIHLKEALGDILVFLTSPLETEKCCEAFQQSLAGRNDFQCFQLHGQLQADEQQKVFEPLGKNKRKIVFATNCAETSITIDGIKYVVDTGVAKEMRYDAKKNSNCLSVTVVSQSSAEQRKGRAGRTAPGKCYRLYSKYSYNAMDKITLPEILRTHLGQALLKLAELGVGPDMYDFVQSPSQEAIEAALESLVQLGALSTNHRITEEGRWIAKLPLDPRLGLMTLKGKANGLLFDSIVLAALTNFGSVFYRGNTTKEQEQHDKSKTRFSQTTGDCLTSLAVYKEWQHVPEKEKNRWCVANSINAKAMRSTRDMANEIIKTLKKEYNLEVANEFSDKETTENCLRHMIFECYIGNLCHYLGMEKAGYFAARVSRQVHVHPSSCLTSLASNPEWVVYEQLIKTSRDFITGVTPVDESWLADVAVENVGLDVEDIRKKKVMNVFTQAAGSHAFFSMVGPRFCRLREYEDLGSSQGNFSVVVVEASREVKEVKVFSTEKANERLVKLVKERVERSARELAREDTEQPVGKEESNLRVVLGTGGKVVELLMPDESRKVFIHRVTENSTEEHILAKFQQFGEIRLCKKFVEGEKWGFLIFKTVAEAVNAAKETGDNEADAGELERRRPLKQNADFKARLKWCRRPSSGFGYASISPAEYATCLLKSCFYVGSNLITIKPARNRENSLYFPSLPRALSEDVLRRSLLHELGYDENTKGIVERVTIVRQKPYQTTDAELRDLEMTIEKTFQAYLRTSQVKVSVEKPHKETSVMFGSEAVFTDPIEGIQACKRLQTEFYIHDQPVDVVPVIYATLTVPNQVLKVADAKVKDALNHFSGLAEIKSKPVHNDKHIFYIRASEVEDMVKVRKCLSDIFKGEVLDCRKAPALAHLLNAAGLSFLRETQHKTSTYISVDSRLGTIAIHGTEAACTQVYIEVNNYLDLVQSGTVEEMTLKGGDRPAGVLKALLMEYGEDLDRFRASSGLFVVSVDYRKHKLRLTGSPESIEKAHDIVNKVVEKMKRSSRKDDEEDTIDCVICQCPVEAKELYRLELCAHPYCLDCLKHQVAVAVTTRSLPVVCGREGCEREVAVRDLTFLTRRGDVNMSALTAAALSAFVMRSGGAARFCVTPDCPVVYRTTAEEHAKVFVCPDCSVRLCTACHQQAHDGMTCAILRANKEGWQDVELWARQDPTRRKPCPGCYTPIEKTGGCRRMFCTVCKTTFCWMCSKKFASECACYEHLTIEHGGIFGENEL
ncbi:hypothetical protein C0Q70_07103 [Pomacea canaliculata]|uniref:RNA helicase n=1 Tax=Pomacea canaliculata TaxID=400727 RepID=A0A2T7PE45_POMCA|nr:pre-mRNA-splicing factor ATP-dependent RNA helicase DEAH1-like [Pomacea canaliculata]XP_025090493.1 pre-mRNA-splicing factor ATP-dependent RNA helicase DEAH1-like [Pomacea canaliculata]XP_025090494.1 pre-mRNA-splicing factor ATP-dependent RNA helicase DEAH1-like [Pomacea canaliculata]PVD31685.1 hypothetical protein C0Q70_07103 [Pomacea canaliculata]